MLKILGAVLLTSGAAAFGFSAAGHLNRRVNSLRAILGALALMDRELSFRLTPTPELLALLAKRAQAPACHFFARCTSGLDHLGEQSLCQIWHTALVSYPMDLSSEDCCTLEELGEVLGRYDGPGQRAALAEIHTRLNHSLANAEEERGRMGRVYGALGLTIGSFLAVLLL
ncbi:MAG: stage III sporulation protein AB [Oscillospiraceae bacterium]|nr:stage III sporulation protein AB [Oscillospiraceae bacterium]